MGEIVGEFAFFEDTIGKIVVNLFRFRRLKIILEVTYKCEILLMI